MFRICFALLLVAVINADARYDGSSFISKVKRQTENSERECFNFDWTLDVANKKYYSCCKENINCTTNTQESISTNYECAPYGNELYTKNVTSTFNCGRCNGKTWAMEKCNARWKLAGLDDATDRCWIWSECFKGACAAQEAIYKDDDPSTSVPQERNFCGDGFCLKSTGETVDNCPMDCCPTKNSAQCAVTSEKCTDPCCNESSCCIESFGILYIAILCGGIGFINLLCCCFCVCCYRKIKRACGFKGKRLSKSISIDNLSRDSPKSTTSLNRKGYPQNNLSYKSNSLASLNKKVYYVSRGDHSPRPLNAKSSSLTSLNKKGLSRSTQSLDPNV